MNYIKITECDIMNGPGVGIVLWVSGCRCKCEGCYNQESGDFCAGQPFTKETEDYVLKLFDNKYYTRLTLSGGHPFEMENEEVCERLCRKLKEKRPDVQIGGYSGWYWQSIKNDSIMNFLDVVVDGPFKPALYEEDLSWRGSSNQTVIDVQKSLETGEKVEAKQGVIK